MTRTIYGELLFDPLAGNHRGKVYRIFDGAGAVTSIAYDRASDTTPAEETLSEKNKSRSI